MSIRDCPKVPITEVLSFIVDNRGKTVPTSETGFPLIATNCVLNERLYPVFEKIRFVSDDVLNNWFRAHLEPNDILFVNKGTPGRCCLVPDPVSFCVAQDMIGLRCDAEKIYYRYLLMVLRSPEIQKTISNNHVGLVIPHFKKENLSQLQIPLPDMAEQRELGDFYYNICNQIENNNTICSDLEAMAKLLYDYWFVQFDFPDENGKPYKSSGGKMVWNEELKREIPEGWVATNICHIAKILSGGTPSKAVNEYWYKGTIPFFGPTDYENTMFQFNTKDHITEIGLNACSSSLYDIGTVIITARGSIGKMVIVGSPMAMNQSCYAFRAYNTKHIPYLYFISKQVIELLKVKGSGSVFKSIIVDDIESSLLPIGPGKIIDNFCQKVTPMFEEIMILEKENQQLAELRDFLLPMLMNGQVKIA